MKDCVSVPPNTGQPEYWAKHVFLEATEPPPGHCCMPCGTKLGWPAHGETASISVQPNTRPRPFFQGTTGSTAALLRAAGHQISVCLNTCVSVLPKTVPHCSVPRDTKFWSARHQGKRGYLCHAEYPAKVFFRDVTGAHFRVLLCSARHQHLVCLQTGKGLVFWSPLNTGLRPILGGCNRALASALLHVTGLQILVCLHMGGGPVVMKFYPHYCKRSQC